MIVSVQFFDTFFVVLVLHILRLFSPFLVFHLLASFTRI